MRGTNAPEVCALLDPAELTKCDMVLMDDSHCYFGNFSMANGSMVPTGVSWDLYIKQGKQYWLKLIPFKNDCAYLGLTLPTTTTTPTTAITSSTTVTTTTTSLSTTTSTATTTTTTTTNTMDQCPPTGYIYRNGSYYEKVSNKLGSAFMVFGYMVFLAIWSILSWSRTEWAFIQ